MTIIAGRCGTLNARKFKNVPTTRGELKFHSKKEARRYDQLKLLERAERVRDLRLQVKYRLEVNGILIATYAADFVYEEFEHGRWKPVVEDVKGMLTPVYRLKKKLMKAILGIEIRET